MARFRPTRATVRARTTAGRTTVQARASSIRDFAGHYTTAQELYETKNAIATGSNEADATTGWTAVGLAGTGLNVFESQGVEVNGSSYAFKCDANDTPTSSARIHTNLSSILTSGTTYTINVDVKHSGTPGADGVWRVAIGTSDSAFTEVVAAVDATKTSWVTYSLDFTYSGSNHFLVIREFNAANDGAIYIDNLSIKEK